MSSSVLRKKSTTRSGLDHDRGLTGKYAMATGVKEKPNPPRILTLKTPVKLESTIQV